MAPPSPDVRENPLKEHNRSQTGYIPDSNEWLPRIFFFVELMCSRRRLSIPHSERAEEQRENGIEFDENDPNTIYAQTVARLHHVENDPLRVYVKYNAGKEGRVSNHLSEQPFDRRVLGGRACRESQSQGSLSVNDPTIPRDSDEFVDITMLPTVQGVESIGTIIVGEVSACALTANRRPRHSPCRVAG